MSRLTGLIIEGAAHPWPEALGHAVLQIPPSAAAEPRTDLIGPGCHDIVLDTKSWTFSDLEQQAVVAVPYAEPIAPYRRSRVVSISIKQKVLDAVQQQPPDATVEDAIERLYLLTKVERGVAQADAGETLPHEVARRRLLTRTV